MASRSQATKAARTARSATAPSATVRSAFQEESPRQGVTVVSLLSQGADPLALLAETEEREAWTSRKAEKAAQAATEIKAKEEAEKAATAEAKKEKEAARKAAEKAAQEVLRLRARIRLHQEALIVWRAFEAASAAEKRRMLTQMGENSLRAASLAQEMLEADKVRLAALVQQ